MTLLYTYALHFQETFQRFFWVVFGATINKCVHCSRGVLSLEEINSGEVSVPRSAPQHDQRRLCVLHVLAVAFIHQWQTVDFVDPLCWWLNWSSETSASFPRRQTGSWRLFPFVNPMYPNITIKCSDSFYKAEVTYCLVVLTRLVTEFLYKIQNSYTKYKTLQTAVVSCFSKAIC